MSRRVCVVSGCGTLVDAGARGGRCPVHRAEARKARGNPPDANEHRRARRRLRTDKATASRIENAKRETRNAKRETRNAKRVRLAVGEGRETPTVPRPWAFVRWLAVQSAEMFQTSYEAAQTFQRGRR